MCALFLSRLYWSTTTTKLINLLYLAYQTSQGGVYLYSRHMSTSALQANLKGKRNFLAHNDAGNREGPPTVTESIIVYQEGSHLS